MNPWPLAGVLPGRLSSPASSPMTRATRENNGSVAGGARPRRPARAGVRMVMAILSRNSKLYSTRRLLEAAETLGHDAMVLDTLRCQMVLDGQRPQIFYRGEEVHGVEVVIPRIGASITGYGLSVVNQFDMMGVPVLKDRKSVV